MVSFYSKVLFIPICLFFQISFFSAIYSKASGKAHTQNRLERSFCLAFISLSFKVSPLDPIPSQTQSESWELILQGAAGSCRVDLTQCIPTGSCKPPHPWPHNHQNKTGRKYTEKQHLLIKNKGEYHLIWSPSLHFSISILRWQIRSSGQEFTSNLVDSEHGCQIHFYFVQHQDHECIGRVRCGNISLVELPIKLLKIWKK